MDAARPPQRCGRLQFLPAARLLQVGSQPFASMREQHYIVFQQMMCFHGCWQQAAGADLALMHIVKRALAVLLLIIDVPPSAAELVPVNMPDVCSLATTGVEQLRVAAGAGINTRDNPLSLENFEPSEDAGGLLDRKTRRAAITSK